MTTRLERRRAARMVRRWRLAYGGWCPALAPRGQGHIVHPAELTADGPGGSVLYTACIRDIGSQL